MIHFIFGVLTLSAVAQNITPRGARVENWTLSGSGCDMNNVSVNLSPEAQEISFLFDSYSSDIGPASSMPFKKELIKNCMITLNLIVPNGWQMAFKSADYRGYANLPQVGSSAFHRLSLLQQGAPIVSMREVSMIGPMNEDYFFRAQLNPQRLTWSPCLSGHTQVRIDSQLGVRINPRASALAPHEVLSIVLDSSDISIKQSLGVEWRKCETISRPPPNRPPRYQPRR